MDNSRDSLGPCVCRDCCAPGYARFRYPFGTLAGSVVFCRAHLEQMLTETGLIEKPEYRALLDAP